MNKTIVSILFIFLAGLAIAQDKAAAEELVTKGITLHDAGKYDEAIKLYDKALDLDKDNFYALSEKAMTLNAMGEYANSVKCSERSIVQNKGNEYLNSVYVTLGNSYDSWGKPEKALEAYDAGIKIFPDYYQLHFNKGVTLSGLKKSKEAITCFEKSALLAPNHPGTQNALAGSMFNQAKNIPAIMAYARFMIVEPNSKRFPNNFEYLQSLMNAGLEKTGKNKYTLNIDLNVELDEKGNPVKKENDFSLVEMIFSLGSALDNDKKNKNETDREKFERKFTTLCTSLKENRDKNSGFYWEYYGDYFIDMLEDDQITTFSYIVFVGQNDKKVNAWLKDNGTKIDAFYNWSEDHEFDVAKK